MNTNALQFGFLAERALRQATVVVERQRADPQRPASSGSQATHSHPGTDAPPLAEEGRRAQRHVQEPLLCTQPHTRPCNSIECFQLSRFGFRLQKKQLDSDCVTKLAIHHEVSLDSMHSTVSEWAYDYTTATYLLLLHKKQKKRPIRFAVTRSTHASPAPCRRARLLSSDDDDVMRDDNAPLIESAKYYVNSKVPRQEFESPFCEFKTRHGEWDERPHVLMIGYLHVETLHLLCRRSANTARVEEEGADARERGVDQHAVQTRNCCRPTHVRRVRQHKIRTYSNSKFYR